MRFFFGGIFLQLLGTIMFIEVSGTTFGSLGKPCVIVIFVIATSILLIRAAKIYSQKTMFLLAALLATSTVFMHQLLGFFLFPGLLKDMSFLSREHIILTVLVFVFAFLLYVAGSLLAIVIAKLFSKSGSSSDVS